MSEFKTCPVTTTEVLRLAERTIEAMVGLNLKAQRICDTLHPGFKLMSQRINYLRKTVDDLDETVKRLGEVKT